MGSQGDIASGGMRPMLHVWDSGDCPPRDALPIFREELCNRGLVFQPSTASTGDPFQVRIESRPLDKGYVSKFSTSSLDLRRTRHDIAKSTIDCISVGLILSGSMTIVRDGVHTFNAGDLFVHDLSEPIQMVTRTSRFETIGIALPSGVAPVIDANRGRFNSLLVRKHQISAPLRNCFHFLADRITSDRDELNAIHQAILSLLPIDAGCFLSSDRALTGEVTELYRDMVSFIDGDIRNPGLNASVIAERFGISERYVYKLFAQRGLHVGGRIKERRLDRAAVELALRGGARAPITDIAYKWGFNDLSTFNRSFKAKFGCSPSQYRDRY